MKQVNGARRSVRRKAPGNVETLAVLSPNGTSPDTHQVKDYTQLIEQLKKMNPDWQVNRVGIDNEIYRNHWELRAYSRNLWRENPYIIGYGQDACANIFGPNGYTMRSMVKEEDDRIIHTAQEKAELKADGLRREQVFAYYKKKTGSTLSCRRTFFKEIRGVATIQVGAPDVFARQLIERKWKEWQLKENCTVNGRISYNESRQLRFKSCARDGEHFIRFVFDSKRYQPFGFKIQHINAEWCSYYYSGKCEETGNPVRFGIEYDDSGAAPVPVAYHFVKGTSAQWQGFMPRAAMGAGEKDCVRIEAKDVIHLAKFDDDADVTRPVPWATPVMSNARHTAKWMEAGVVSARVGASSNVFFEADLIGPDGTSAGQVDPELMKKLVMEMNPGGMFGLPPGVKAKVVNPNYPSPTAGSFRTELLREMCAGLPAGQFSTLGQNYAEINFSAGRLERLTITAQWMMLQEWDISMAERPIFEAWLKAALINGAIKLPVEKFWKFKDSKFTGRRWEGVDALKESNAKALDLANKFTSLQRIHDNQGTDLEEILFEIAEANMLMEQLGIETATTHLPMVDQGDENAIVPAGSKQASQPPQK